MHKFVGVSICDIKFSYCSLLHQGQRCLVPPMSNFGMSAGNLPLHLQDRGVHAIYINLPDEYQSMLMPSVEEKWASASGFPLPPRVENLCGTGLVRCELHTCALLVENQCAAVFHHVWGAGSTTFPSRPPGCWAPALSRISSSRAAGSGRGNSPGMPSRCAQSTETYP